MTRLLVTFLLAFVFALVAASGMGRHYQPHPPKPLTRLLTIGGGR